MKKMLKKHKIKLVGIALGAILGYIYQQNWGCTSGCAIRSSASMMTVYGALLGYLLVGLFDGKEKK